MRRLNKFWQFVFVFGFILSLIAVPAVEVQAEGQFEVYECLGTGHNPCKILTESQMFNLALDLHSWGLFLQYGENGPVMKYSDSWTRNENPAGWTTFGEHLSLPDEIHLPKVGYTSIPEMGIFWWNGTLKYAKPGYLLPGEVPTPLPNPTPIKEWAQLKADEIVTPDWEEFDTYESYSWNGSNLILSWIWTPEVTETEVILHIFDFTIGYLEPADHALVNATYEYDYPATIEFVSGEELYVESTNLDSRKVPYNYEVTFSDIVWMYEDDVDELVEGGMSEADAWAKVKEENAVEIEEMTGTFSNYTNTYFRATWEWTDNFVFVRPDGSKVRIQSDNLMADRPCTDAEGCHTAGYDPKAGDIVYVDPFTVMHNLEDGGDPEYSYLHTSSVYPGREILDEDLILLNDRLTAGEVYMVDGIVEGIVEDNGNTVIALTDGNWIYVSAGYMPPIGDHVTAYVYAEDDDFNWPVMALFDSEGKLWYFNTDREYEFNFSHEHYNVK